MTAIIDQIHACGSAYPNHQQMLSMGERVIKTVLMQTIWARAFEHLAPGERRTFGPVTAEWAARLQADIERRLAALEHASKVAA